jgi:hypothetical protein
MVGRCCFEALYVPRGVANVWRIGCGAAIFWMYLLFSATIKGQASSHRNARLGLQWASIVSRVQDPFLGCIWSEVDVNFDAPRFIT